MVNTSAATPSDTALPMPSQTVLPSADRPSSESAHTDCASCDAGEAMEDRGESEFEASIDDGSSTLHAEDTIHALHVQIGRLSRQVDRLQLSLRYLDRQEQRYSSRAQTDVPGQNVPRASSVPQIDVTRVQALAIALIEGQSPTEIAGQLLDEVDRVVSCAEEGDSAGQVDQRGLQVGGTPGRLHELEGVVDVMLTRVGALEDEIEGIQARERAGRL